ncbi:sentrin-specific protease 5-like [Hippocampus comes]|uniref:Sentrin-specific protease 5-like n=1 Tax=Hippocampus comes TaxID=109280 RepID=A0A3Q2Y819_HIPCM|nr:PREDICTED: sentrin-specific protease 5-like [Hippocampus comes]XP_019733649.1 PREDICTED: sentrin-specific protease 5-like [Hippocampus comes]XP_019733650.1 PREDICTED: sentrin-specific protease 5-like [Hippocampus comes]
MVYSNSASPMKTSLTLNITEAAPPEQAAPPPVLPLTDTSNQSLLDSDVSSISDVSQPTIQTLAEAGSPVITPKIKSDWSSPQSTTAIQGTVNGRTSGRKRTPKTCDCCGPIRRGQDVRTSGRGRRRGRGRGRGTGRNLHGTPQRKSDDKLMRITDFDLTGDEFTEAEDENDMQDGMNISNTQSESTAPSRDCISLLDGDVLDNGQLSFPEIMMPATLASKGEAIIGIKPGVENDVIDNSKNAPTLSELVCHQEHVNCITDASQIGNGDSLSLSEAETEAETLEDKSSVSQQGNGTLCSSRVSASPSRPGSPQNHDAEMHVSVDSDRTDSSSRCLSPTLSIGNGTSPADHSPRSTPMEMDSANETMVSSSQHYPVTVCGTQHCCPLIDHRLYCNPGTWENVASPIKNMSEEIDGQDMDGVVESDDIRQRLIHLVHDFLESFYIKYGSFIPLSETDVLEYLKMKGNCDNFSKLGLNIQREMAQYKAALASAPVAGFMVIYNKHTLSLEDLGTLEDQNWINDQIINTYGDLIMEATQHSVHFFNSFFHKQLDAKGYDGVKRWTKKVDLFSKWLLLIPIHLEIHWSLVTVTMATKTINYFDSQGIVFRHTADNIMKYLQSEAQEKKKTDFLKGWKIAIIKGIPQQKNDSDCGVFVLEYCRCLSVKKPLLFSQDDMPRIRKRIYKELCDRHLNS